MAALHAKQAARNRNTPLVDNIVTKKKFRPALPEEDPDIGVMQSVNKSAYRAIREQGREIRGLAGIAILSFRWQPGGYPTRDRTLPSGMEKRAGRLRIPQCQAAPAPL